MDYEKKYNEALERLQALHRDYDNISNLVDVKRELESIFPELRESEEEMTRKKAIAILKQQRDYWSYDGPIDKHPPATLRKDLVEALDIAIKHMKNETPDIP